MSITTPTYNKLVLTVAFALFVMFGLPACSTQYRTSGAMISSDELFERMGNLGTTSSTFNALAQAEGTLIYFSEATAGGGLFGPPVSVLSIVDLSALGFPAGINAVDIDDVDVFFLDGFINGQRQFALGIRIVVDGQSHSVSFEGSSFNFSDEKFEVFMTSGNRQIQLESFDVSEDFSQDLAGVIQLRVFAGDSGSGELVNVGKLSSLIGFGI